MTLAPKRTARAKPNRKSKVTAEEAVAALRRLQQQAAAHGLDKMTDGEIEAEIQAARAGAGTRPSLERGFGAGRPRGRRDHNEIYD
jgi:hypothetical protein